MRTREWMGAILVLGLLLGLSLPALAQEVTANIVGTVTDPSGAPISGATAMAKDTQRGTEWTATTNESGAYTINRVPVGTYEVKISAPGFQTAVYPPFALVLNQTARVDSQMKVGQVSETVEVTGAAPILQTENTHVSTLINATATEALPLASRNYLQLALLAPGATNPNPQTMRQQQTMPSSGRPYINGNREQANAYYLNGVTNAEKNNNEVAYQPSPDAIQEFNIITQNPSAEFGDFQGGVVSVNIKSGTNNYHGSVFEFLRNDKLNANSWSAGLAEGGPFTPGITQPNGVLDKTNLRWNQFGGTFGGPIVKNKLFFFASYQGLRSSQKGVQGYQLFTAREIAGNFSQLCGSTFVGGICQDTGQDSNGKPIFSHQLVVPGTGAGFPLYVNPADNPNGPAGQPAPVLNNNLAAAGFAINPVINNLINLPAYQAALANSIDTTSTSNFFDTTSNTFNNDQGDLKIDYNVSNSDHINFLWSQESVRNPLSAAFLLADPGTSSTEPVKASVVNWTHTFTPSLLNELRVGFVNVRYGQSDFNPAAGNLGEQIQIAGANLFGPGLPILSGGGISFGENGLVQTFHSGTGELEDSLVMTRGRHVIHTGFQYWRDRLNYVFPGNNGPLGQINASNLTGSGQADLWLGLLGGGGRDAGLNQFGRRGNIFGAFIQDDWRVTNTLTLNLGLRFEDHTPLYEVGNREVNFDLRTGAIQVEHGHNALYDNYLGIGDWLPRVGFAWSPSVLQGKTVIRGAIGQSSFMEGGGSNQNLTTNWALTQISSQITPASNLSNPFPQTAPACAAITQACFTGPNAGVGKVRVWPHNYRPGNETQWNLSVQQQLNNTTTFQIGYVGSFGTHLLNLMDFSQQVPLDANGQVARPGVPVASIAPSPFLGGATLNGFPLQSTGPASNSNQSYNALQAVLQKRMSTGLEGQVSYTYSKCLSNSPGFFGTGTWGGNGSQTYMGLPGWQNLYDPKADWGPCYYDTTHALTAFATYQIPVGRGKRFGKSMNPVAEAVIGGWELAPIVNWHTGYAVTPLVGDFSDTSGANGAGILFDVNRPNCSGPAQYLKQKKNGGAPGSGFIQWWDPATFSTPSNSYGNCGVGSLRGPRYSVVDLSVHKSFAITEGKRIEFRSDFTNLFNHPVLDFAGGPSAFSLSSSSFGVINASQGERNIEFALKFVF
ncbi:MAG TPA: carboxypeptidase regulatory-like domain-containing protein [Terriglobales bacterium]|nr:carboxypeptidase regulatory-like domain-containing protein [Terriglobales bacterium]